MAGVGATTGSRAAGGLHPPRARLAFRVGVVGHRPNRLPEDESGRAAIRDLLARTLGIVRGAVLEFSRTNPDAGFYAAGAPLLRAVSPLAEGSDRDFADLAIGLGYELCCPMPFQQAEYEQDFIGPQALEADSLARFRALLKRARDGAGLTAFELDGAREHLARSYGAAGRVVLNQSDLLLVVWDGQEARGGGGTLDTLYEAVRYNVPILWIDAREPFGWRLIREADDLIGLDPPAAFAWRETDARRDEEDLRLAISRVVLRELSLPAANDAERQDAGPGARELARDYFDERRPRRNGAFLWKLFRDFVGSMKVRMPNLTVADFVEQVREAWPVEARDTPDHPLREEDRWANAALREHYAWADKRADLYADAHRSANVASSFLAAGAVLLALLPMALNLTDPRELLFILLELAVLLSIVALSWRGHVRRWRDRWLEYRVLAELIRQLRLSVPLGGGRPLPRAPAHLATYGDPARSWMYWQVRALARAVGIPAARVTDAYVAARVDDVADVIEGPRNGQLLFHQANHARCERIHHRLHSWALVLFVMTIALIGFHFIVAGSGAVAPWLARRLPRAVAEAWAEAVGRWLVLLSAFLPALGAALANINNQGEFRRFAKRSLAMVERLRRHSEAIALFRLDLARPGGLPMTRVTGLANALTEAMVDENMEWRVVSLDLAQSGG